MGMIKIASPLDWTNIGQNPLQDVKVSSRGFMLSDRQKVAAEFGDEFLTAVRKIEDQLDTKNYKFAHAISCGATEFYGSNRNGDGWTGDALRDQMHTYLKHAKAFRNHRNSDQDKFYGRPKVAMYCPERGYGRLLVAYHATKEACEGDPLAKIASAEIDAIERGKEIPVSHGSSIPFDTCSICKKESKTRAEYCDSRQFGGDCDLFGCRHGLSKISEDGRQQFVDNPINRFYDISSIGLVPGAARQADRIAYAEGMKVANDQGGVVGSAKMAEDMHLVLPDSLQLEMVQSPWHRRMLKAAIDLAHDPDQLQLSLYPGDAGRENQPDYAKKADLHNQAANGYMEGAGQICRVLGITDMEKYPRTARVIDSMAKNALQVFYRENSLGDFVVSHPLLSAPAEESAKVAYASRHRPEFSLDAVTVQRNKVSASLVSGRPEAIPSATLAKCAADVLARYVLATALKK